MSNFDTNNLPPVTLKPLSRLPTDKATLYLTRLNSINARLTALEAQYDSMMASPVESYTFAGGQGQQSAKRRPLKDVADQIQYWTTQYNYYWNKLNGYGNVTMTLRRR